MLIVVLLYKDAPTTEFYTLSLHDALPIYVAGLVKRRDRVPAESREGAASRRRVALGRDRRSEEHTSELQSLTNLVCRLLLEKKKTKKRLLGHCQESSNGARKPSRDTVIEQ